MSSPPSPLALEADVSDDDNKELFTFSLSSSSLSPRHWRTISTAPSPRNEAESVTSSLTREQPVYRGTALTHVDDAYEADIGSDGWGQQTQQVRFGRKELTLDTFSQDEDEKLTDAVKSLDLPDVELISAAAPSLAPLALPAVFDEAYSFVSSSSASSLLAAVSSTVRAFPSEVSFAAHPTSPRLSGVFYDDNKPVSFRVSVFTSDDGESRVVEVQRRSGEMAAFHSLYRYVIDSMRRAGHFAAQTFDMDRMEPPSLGTDDDDDMLEMSVMDMYRIKAQSYRYSDARDGLHGLLTPTSVNHTPLFSSSELLPVIQHGIESDHDVEQQRLAVQLLNSHLSPTSPTSPVPHDLLLPLVPSLLSTARTLPVAHHTVSMRTGLIQALDALRNHSSALADALEADSDVVDFLRQTMQPASSAVGAC